MELAVVLLTAKSVETIVAEGGSSAWRLDPKNARQCNYAVCTRNGNAKWAEGAEAHKAAFLVGRISGVTPFSTDDKTERFIIQFSEYALVDVPGFWPGDRNPVKYVKVEDLNMDLTALEWRPMADSAGQPSAGKRSATSDDVIVGALTMEQAKRGLALTFGVKPEAIEIVIRG